jgi:ribonucleotide monophosphatase NagD (HAD superfamily)
MIEAARRDLVLSTGGWIAGDAATDIELGVRAGLKTVMVLTGRGVSQLEKIRNNNGPMPDFVVDDLAGAVELILSYSKV